MNTHTTTQWHARITDDELLHALQEGMYVHPSALERVKEKAVSSSMRVEDVLEEEHIVSHAVLDEAIAEHLRLPTKGQLSLMHQPEETGLIVQGIRTLFGSSLADGYTLRCRRAAARKGMKRKVRLKKLRAKMTKENLWHRQSTQEQQVEKPKKQEVATAKPDTRREALRRVAEHLKHREQMLQQQEQAKPHASFVTQEIEDVDTGTKKEDEKQRRRQEKESEKIEKKKKEHAAKEERKKKKKERMEREKQEKEKRQQEKKNKKKERAAAKEAEKQRKHHEKMMKMLLKKKEQKAEKKHSWFSWFTKEGKTSKQEEIEKQKQHEKQLLKEAREEARRQHLIEMEKKKMEKAQRAQEPISTPLHSSNLPHTNQDQAPATIIIKQETLAPGTSAVTQESKGEEAIITTTSQPAKEMLPNTSGTASAQTPLAEAEKERIRMEAFEDAKRQFQTEQVKQSAPSEDVARERAQLQRERELLEQERIALRDQQPIVTHSTQDDSLEMAKTILAQEKAKMMQERLQWEEERRRLKQQALEGSMNAASAQIQAIAESQSQENEQLLEQQRHQLEEARLALEAERKKLEEERKSFALKQVAGSDAQKEEVGLTTIGPKAPEPGVLGEEEDAKKTKKAKKKKKKDKKEEAPEEEEEDEEIDVGAILFKQNYISEEEYKKAQENAKRRHIPIDMVLREEGLITRELVQNAIAEHFAMPFLDLRSQPPDKTVLELLPEKQAIALNAIAVEKKEDGTLIVATNHPERRHLERDIRRSITEGGVETIQLAYASKESIESSLAFYRKALDTRFQKILERQKKVAPEIIEEIFLDAIHLGASDIHFEPHEKIVIVRFRVDGVMHEAGQIPKLYYEGIVNRIKIAANIRIDEHFIAQDGAIRWKHGKKAMDVRVSIVPIVDGEKIVMRLLSDYVRTLTLNDLGFTTHQKDILVSAAHKPFGMILTTGPTGSGKSTTLYGLLKMRNTPDVNISTIEDPVEYKIPGINHIQVNQKAGLTFERGLRALVRQDPDIILVGEIRDATTAEISVHAALTGHLLFSTLHANDAATAVPRLTEMGIEPYLLASTLEVIIAQRLLRRVCKSCRYSYRVGSVEAQQLFPHADRYFKKDQEYTLYRGRGCESCGNKGYKGRVGIYELFVISPEIEEFIVKQATSTDLNRLARSQGMKTLFEDGLEKAQHGLTTIEELLRIAAPPEEALQTPEQVLKAFRSEHENE